MQREMAIVLSPIATITITAASLSNINVNDQRLHTQGMPERALT